MINIGNIGMKYITIQYTVQQCGFALYTPRNIIHENVVSNVISYIYVREHCISFMDKHHIWSKT